MQLVVGGIALQPCSPKFHQARDAIIDADKALTRGQNFCALWTGFGKRGLGQGATRGSRTAGKTRVMLLLPGCAKLYALIGSNQA